MAVLAQGSFFLLNNYLICIVVILWASLIAQMVKNPSTTQETGV